MASLGDVLKPVSATEQALRDVGRREREDLERRGAMLRAENAGRAAADAGVDWLSSPAEHVERFDTQLQLLEQRMSTMPRVDVTLAQHRQQRWEAMRFGAALRDAERGERRLESAKADPRAGAN